MGEGGVDTADVQDRTLSSCSEEPVGGWGCPRELTVRQRRQCFSTVALAWLSKVGFLFSKPMKHICLLSFLY